MKNSNPFVSRPPEIQSIITELKSPMFSVKDSRISYRTLHHYQELNIIEPKKSKINSWRKFTGIDLIWIDTIVQLRNFGIGLDKLKSLKMNLFDKGNLGTIDKVQLLISNSFENEIALAILKHYQLYLVIFPDFTFSFHDSQTLKQLHLKSYKEEAHINIPLTKTINEVYKRIMANRNIK